MSSCKPVTCKSFVMGFATHGRNATKSGRALKYFSSRTRSILIRVRLIKRSTCGHSVSYNQELSAGVSHVPCWCLLQTVSIITMIPLSVQTCLNLTCIHLWARVNDWFTWWNLRICWGYLHKHNFDKVAKKHFKEDDLYDKSFSRL